MLPRAPHTSRDLGPILAAIRRAFPRYFPHSYEITLADVWLGKMSRKVLGQIRGRLPRNNETALRSLGSFFEVPQRYQRIFSYLCSESTQESAYSFFSTVSEILACSGRSNM